MASTKLTRTPSTTTAVDAWTFSVWLKRSSTTPVGSHDICSGRNNTDGGNNQSTFSFDANDNLFFDVYNGGIIVVKFITNRKFRDLNAWYHIVLDFDSSTAGARSAADRMKVWVNGIRETSFSTEVQSGADQETNFCQQNDCPIGIGATASPGRTATYNGLMSHINYVAGVGHPASYFGETDATTGIWKPITAPSVTYGTNGFFLKFENSADMDLDSSPNNLTFSTSGTLTQTVDTPSNVFTTWNPLENYYQSATLSNGNTTIQTGSSQYSPSSSTLGVSSGKWYWEVEYDALSGGSDVAYVGVLSQFATNSTTSLGTNANDYGYYVNGNYYNNNTGTAYGTTYTTGDIIGVALDLDNNKLYFSKNGTWQNSGDPESGATGTGAISITNPTSTTNGAYFPSICDGSSSANATFKTNFGNGYFGTTAVASAGSNGNGAIFEFDCPSGYYALNTKNINTYG
jgi:hypothetical protein